MDMALKKSFCIVQQNPVVGTTVSVQVLKDSRTLYVNRLKRTLQVTAIHARERGLTQNKLDELLSDES